MYRSAPMSRRSLQFTRAARRDFRSIQRYTRRTQGTERRDAYADRLNAAIDDLTRFPELGRLLDQTPTNVRYLPVQNHVVYYCIEAERLSIIRILHKRMEIERQLEES